MQSLGPRNVQWAPSPVLAKEPLDMRGMAAFEGKNILALPVKGPSYILRNSVLRESLSPARAAHFLAWHPLT